MIGYFVPDLLFATRIRSTAESLGLSARPIRSADMLSQRLAEGEVLTGLIVDLESADAGIRLLQHARSAAPGFRAICFGPHVQADALAVAKRAGFDEVMPRSRFAAELPELLRQLAGPIPQAKR